MEPLHIVALISFVSGALGYIIFKFWIRPIWSYRKLKSRILSDLRRYDPEDTFSGATASEQKKKLKTELQRKGAELTDLYNYDLPRWYTMVLQQRGEDPIAATKYLLQLPNTPDAANAKQQLKKVKEYLSIK